VRHAGMWQMVQEFERLYLSTGFRTLHSVADYEVRLGVHNLTVSLLEATPQWRQFKTFHQLHKSTPRRRKPTVT